MHVKRSRSGDPWSGRACPLGPSHRCTMRTRGRVRTDRSVARRATARFDPSYRQGTRTMREIRSQNGRASSAPAPAKDGAAGDLQRLCSSLTEIGLKLDRLEDTLHDLTQVLARAVGPPW